MAIKAKGKGKSGGARVITFNVLTDVENGHVVFFLLLYDKEDLKKIKYTQKPISIDTPTIDTNLAFATKSSEWSYENEVRLIDYNPNIESPYYGIKLDASSYIEAIYFGYRCDSQTISTIKALFNNSEKYPNFFKMKLNVKDVYNMDFIKI